MNEEIKGKMFFALAIFYLLAIGTAIMWYYISAKDEIDQINESVEIKIEHNLER